MHHQKINNVGSITVSPFIRDFREPGSPIIPQDRDISKTTREVHKLLVHNKNQAAREFAKVYRVVDHKVVFAPDGGGFTMTTKSKYTGGEFSYNTNDIPPAQTEGRKRLTVLGNFSIPVATIAPVFEALMGPDLVIPGRYNREEQKKMFNDALVQAPWIKRLSVVQHDKSTVQRMGVPLFSLDNRGEVNHKRSKILAVTEAQLFDMYKQYKARKDVRDLVFYGKN